MDNAEKGHEYIVYEVTNEKGILVSTAIGVFDDRAKAHALAYEKGKIAAVEKNGKTYRIQSNADIYIE